MSRDTVTTILGAGIAAATAANPILLGVTTGSLHQADWIQLATSVLFAVFGFFTNKKDA